jgi:hypothetical protein
MVLTQYYADLDGPEPDRGLDVATPDVRFYLAMPGRNVEGHRRDDLAAYIAGRSTAGKQRRHHLVVSAVQDDLEFHYGMVLEAGRPTGALLSAVHTTPDGRFDRYLTLFQAAVPLLGEFESPGS